MANLRLAELDFDAIKDNFKEFLKNYTDDDGTPYFTDFDFEGSGLSILLDLLAYNTHYNAYLSNMVINEMFLDSAVKRESAVSLAKHLGYTPTSVKGAKATLTFTVTNPTGNPAFLTLEKFTPFTTDIGENKFTFVNLESVTIQPTNGEYVFEDVVLTEGIPLEYAYTVDVPGPAEKYVIPNENIDTSTIRVVVQNSFSDTTTETYNLSDNVLNIDSTSKVFFLEENAQGKYQIYFGDGILGKKLTRNNIVKITYVVSNGSLCNVSGNIEQEFTCETIIGGGSVTGSIIATLNSTGGSDRETIDSIKFKAPKFLSAQNRAVTGDDYSALVQKNYPLIESVSIWGGETNDPPKYGKVFISLKPYSGYEITDQVKNSIRDTLLQAKQVVTISPEFVDPDYFYVNLDVKVKYNSRTTKYTATEIKNLAINAIQNYFATELQQFNKDFVFSKLSRQIDAIDSSIIGNLITLRLQKRITPIINSANNSYLYNNTIKFKNGIVPGTLQSTTYVVNKDSESVEVRIVDIPDTSPPSDTGTGTLRLINATTLDVINTNYGKVNYGTGEVSIDNIAIVGYTEDASDIRFTAEVQNSFLDVVVGNNQILVLDDSTKNGLVNRDAGLTVSTISVTNQ